MVPTYTPAHFSLTDPRLIRQFLQQHYFGLLLTADLQLSALPLWFDWDSPSALTGTLYCHLARQNPQLAALEQAMQQGDSVKVVVQGPHAYVAAECYREQPQVATWNYSLVEISGSLRLLDQSATLALVRKQQAAASRALPQAVQDSFVDRPVAVQAERSNNRSYEKQLSAAIVGLAINIETLHAKMKLSQNKKQAAREDVLQFLQQTEQPQTVWQLMLAQGLIAV
ncbi:FMN-binding negative transcriptional regulator [Rheinheimera riviphila]|uniref:FMN-binding negative transcriptional regulator n=1 Tax=Rheinheimera riviphila TaxID=1834037 RepID=A0A437QLQ2_9GAMM|nr:FMN-binding negative transcriptional regulator [Rheinheimera riviphila]RVU35437.1 FMN-binding negative transcriptional regulator [Rheinheimera riviphila]